MTCSSLLSTPTATTSCRSQLAGSFTAAHCGDNSDYLNVISRDPNWAGGRGGPSVPLYRFLSRGLPPPSFLHRNSRSMSVSPITAGQRSEARPRDFLAHRALYALCSAYVLAWRFLLTHPTICAVKGAEKGRKRGLGFPSRALTSE